MAGLEALATSLAAVDVVAYTGDSFSYSFPQLPVSWSSWPQRTKLAVPGEHDNPDTFENLKTWTTRSPWHTRVADLVLSESIVDKGGPSLPKRLPKRRFVSPTAS
jgi:hypothetical protein